MRDNLEFRGPIDTFHKADDYLHAIQKLSAIVEGVDILRVFEDGNDVSLFCDLKTKTVGTSFVAEWYQVKNDKIASVRVAFDARPFAAMPKGHDLTHEKNALIQNALLEGHGHAREECRRLASSHGLDGSGSRTNSLELASVQV